MWASWFNVKILCHLPKQSIYVSDMILTTNWDCFSKQYSLGGFRNAVGLLCKKKLNI